MPDLIWPKILHDSFRNAERIPFDLSEQGISDFNNMFATHLYSEVKRIRNLFVSPVNLDADSFSDLPRDEKQFWVEFVDGIPDKLATFNLLIRPYKVFCKTCLIPDHDIEKMAKSDYDQYRLKYKAEGVNHYEARTFILPFYRISLRRRAFFIEMNYLIPVILKKFGFEVIRPEEIAQINEKVTIKIAKAIHSQYQHEIRKQGFAEGGSPLTSGLFTTGDFKNIALKDFDELPDEIKYSNIDNAYHIPTKLLSIGYRIRPVSSGHQPFALHLSKDEVETMAILEHLRWCWDKRLNGWVPSKTKDPERKTHPGLVPYEWLVESEKEKDRELVRLIPGLLKDIGYEVCPVNPGIVRRLSYAIKPQSSIHKILVETREMNDKIRKMVNLSPEVEEMVQMRNKKIEDAIREVEGNYNYAHYIQKTFLPDDLYIRECFQDSFVLFKPKDIVSGDFYFFSKQKDIIIFAAADCTGHGIPAALLSTLGYGILDQAVNEIKLKDPGKILYHLYSKIHRFLRNSENETGLSDDLDIALCTLDIKSNTLIYAGVAIPLYRITNGHLIEYKAGNLKEICYPSANFTFASENIKLNVGDTLYLSSDGFCDQFGGMEHKKYQSSRFKNFLISIQENTLPEQSDRLNEEIENWRDQNNEDQTDDIMVIGIRI